jgi:hypothetical protein
MWPQIPEPGKPASMHKNIVTWIFKVSNPMKRILIALTLLFGSVLAASGQLTLYGLTLEGGGYDEGALFSYETVSEVNSNEQTFSSLSTGEYPNSSLLLASNGKIYGTTTAGGGWSDGVLFEYDPATGIFLKKHTFSSSSSGRVPTGELIQASNGNIFGYTKFGGGWDEGTLFEYNPTTGVLTKRVTFSSLSDGENPIGRLIEASNGKLYGLTEIGGGFDDGVLFEYDPVTTVFINKVTLSGLSKGRLPTGYLVEAPNGKLYGLTTAGGGFDEGILFEYDPLTNTYTKEVTFSSVSKGETPFGALLEASNGLLYGLTKIGGGYDDGVLFSYDYTVDAFTKEATFLDITYGQTPVGKLVEGSNGKLYGCTKNGGGFDDGVLYEFDMTTSTLTKKVTFSSPSTGENPIGNLFHSSNGKLYGLTEIGAGFSDGALFEYDYIADVFDRKVTFSGLGNGQFPLGCLVERCFVPKYTSLAASVTICEGQALTISLGSSNTLNYSWELNAVNLPSQTTDVLSINSVSFSDSGYYHAEMTNACGAVITDSILVNIVARPTVLANASADTVCAGDNVTLSGVGANTYTWDNGVTDSIQFTATTPTTYTVIGVDNNLCTDTAQITITVNALPVVGVNATNDTLCAGASTTLSGTGASSYSLNNGVFDGVLFAPLLTDTYVVTGVDTNGCSQQDSIMIVVNALPNVGAQADYLTLCQGQSVILSGTGAVSYLWDNGAFDGTPFSPAGTTTFTVTGTDNNNCEDTTQITVTVYATPPPAVTANSSFTEICSGDTLLLYGTGAATYLWDNSVTDSVYFTSFLTAIYHVEGVDSLGCHNTDSVVVVVNPLPPVDAGPTQNVCVNDSTALVGTGAITFVWDNGITNGMYFTPSSTMTYHVEGVDSLGCYNTASVLVVVNPLPAVDAGGTQYICENDNATLSGSGAATYVWDNGAVNGVSFTPDSTTTYMVTGTDNNSCVNIDWVIIVVNPLPTPTVTQAVFDLETSNYTTYQWFFNGSAIGGATGQTHTPTQNGDYHVEVIDAFGCRGTSAIITVLNVGISSEESEANFCYLYPNPTSSTISLKWNKRPDQIHIYDVFGKHVSEVNPFADGQLVDVSSFSSGLYFLVVQVGYDEVVLKFSVQAQ